VVLERIVEVGLRTQSNLEVLGRALKKAYPIQDAACFSTLVRALEEADRKGRHEPQNS
jgi:hypothetical protein